MPTPAQRAYIQKMIDAGASEDELRVAIEHFNQPTPQAVPAKDSLLDTPVNLPFIGPVTARGFMQGAAGGAEQLGRGLVHGAATAIPNTAIGLTKGTIESVQGLLNLYNAPQDTMDSVSAALAKLPANAQKAVTDYLEKVQKNPESLSRDIGETIGGGAAMAGLAEIAPLLPRPLALRVGQGMAKVGKTGEFAAYLTGAHQIASGNPAGLATMAVPAGLRTFAKPLIRFGVKGSNIPVGEQIGLQPEVQPAPLYKVEPTLPETPAPAPGRSPAPPIQSARPAGNLNDQPLFAQQEALQNAPQPPEPLPNPRRGPEPPLQPSVPVTPPALEPGALTAQEIARFKRQGMSDKTIAVIDATSRRQAGGSSASAAPTPSTAPMSYEDAISELERQTAANAARPTNGPLPLESGPMPQELRDAINNVRLPGHIRGVDLTQSTPSERAVYLQAQQMLQDKLHPPPTVQEQMQAAINNEKGAGVYPGMTVEGSGQLDPVTAASVGPEAPGFGLFGRRLLEAGTPPTEGTTVAPTEQSTPAPESGFAQDLAATDAEAAGQPVEKPRIRAVPIEAADIASKSKRGKALMSKTPGLTIADMNALGIHPDTALTHLTPDQITTIRNARKARSQMYSTNAGLDKGFAQQLADQSE